MLRYAKDVNEVHISNNEFLSYLNVSLNLILVATIFTNEWWLNGEVAKCATLASTLRRNLPKFAPSENQANAKTGLKRIFHHSLLRLPLKFSVPLKRGWEGVGRRGYRGC